MRGGHVAVVLVALVALSVPASTGGPSGAAGASHEPPTADAGPDREVPVGTNVTLDGSRSLDPDSGSLSFVWVLVENPGNDELRGDDTVTPTFTPSTSGTYVAALTVTDSRGRRDSDRVTINVTAAAVGRPTLDATLGNDSVVPGERTNLSVTLANTGGVEQGSPDSPSLTDRIGTARGLNVSVGRERGPLRVLTGSFGVGSLADGEATTLSVPVSVAEDARPGTYRVPVNVSFAYTAWIRADGNESSERARRDLSLDLTVEAAPRFRVANSSTDLRVNDTDTLAVTVENVGRASAAEATVELSSSDPSLAVGGGDAATRFVGDWPTGETRTVAFELTAAGSAGPQPYPLSLSVEWDDDGRLRSSTRTVAVQPRPEGRFGVEAGDSALSVDATGRLRGTLTNEGSEPVENAVVVLADRPETLLPRETRQAVRTLAPGESAAFEFPVEVTDAASPGPHQVGVVVRYRDADGTQRESRPLDLRTSVAPERPAFRVTADDPALAAGGGATIDVSVTNAGDEAARDVTVKAFPGGPLGAPRDEASIPALDPGESADVQVGLSAASAAPGKTYPVAFDVRYVDADGETRIAGTYRIPVRVVAPADDGGGPPVVPLGVGLVVVVVLVWYYRRGGFRWRQGTSASDLRGILRGMTDEAGRSALERLRQERRLDEAHEPGLRESNARDDETD